MTTGTATRRRRKHSSHGDQCKHRRWTYSYSWTYQADTYNSQPPGREMNRKQDLQRFRR